MVVWAADPATTSFSPSPTRTVVYVATEAATVEPRVTTFVVGLSKAYIDDLDKIAAAGSTGEAILIDSDPATAQKFVTTLKTVRDTQRLCRYAVPDVGATKATARDLTVTTQLSPDAAPSAVPIARAAPGDHGKECGFTCGSDPSGARTLDCTVL